MKLPVVGDDTASAHQDTISASSTAAVTETESVDVAVLLVQGKGDQIPGSTLVENGYPIIVWMARRLQRQQRTLSHRWSLHVQNTRFCVDEPIVHEQIDSDFLPFTEVFLSRNEEFHGRESKKLVLTESCIAGENLTPTFSEVAMWSVFALPYGFFRRIELACKSRVHPHVFLSSVLGLILAPMIQLALVALIPLAAIPQMRSFVVAVQKRLSGSTGDAYFLITSPLRHDAMVHRFQSDLEYVRTAWHPKKLIVVAHSQGATIAVEALSNDMPGRADELITYGSGVSVLFNLQHRLDVIATKRALLIVIAAICFLTLGLWVWGVKGILEAKPDRWEIWHAFGNRTVQLTLLFPIAMFFVLSCLVGKRFESCRTVKSRVLGLMERDNKLTWLDITATCDPVTLGQGISPESNGSRIESQFVTNKMSVMRDHTTYWQNVLEFVPQVAGRVLHAIDDFDDKIEPDEQTRGQHFASASFGCRLAWIGSAWLQVLSLIILVASPRHANNTFNSLANPVFDHLGWISELSSGWIERPGTRVQEWLQISDSLTLFSAWSGVWIFVVAPIARKFKMNSLDQRVFLESAGPLYPGISTLLLLVAYWMPSLVAVPFIIFSSTWSTFSIVSSVGLISVGVLSSYVYFMRLNLEQKRPFKTAMAVSPQRI